MLEEIDNSQEPKKKTISKKKEDVIVEKYQYVADEGEKLLMDKPSEPVIKKIEKVEKDLNFSVISNEIKIEKKVIMKSNKELYESYIKDLKYFSLNLNGDVIYDSSIDKSKQSPLKFENDFFILYGKKYSYNGLKIQKINIR
jgi:hypothetical protein